jgi:hypothetical protein
VGCLDGKDVDKGKGKRIQYMEGRRDRDGFGEFFVWIIDFFSLDFY